MRARPGARSHAARTRAQPVAAARRRARSTSRATGRAVAGAPPSRSRSATAPVEPVRASTIAVAVAAHPSSGVVGAAAPRRSRREPAVRGRSPAPAPDRPAGRDAASCSSYVLFKVGRLQIDRRRVAARGRCRPVDARDRAAPPTAARSSIATARSWRCRSRPHRSASTRSSSPTRTARCARWRPCSASTRPPQAELYAALVAKDKGFVYVQREVDVDDRRADRPTRAERRQRRPRGQARCCPAARPAAA